jgi:16S rRNA (adenine1518-N6/adenine1519-N6)-dimethyltransferase
MIHPKHILDRHGISPKKSLGQNFISDDYVLARIATAADLASGDEVLEIGPGLGALTRQLAVLAKQVIAVELDNRLLRPLEEQLAGLQNVRLVHGDILAFSPMQYFEADYKVVANLPYYITGAVLRHLLSADRKPVLMVLTVQHEVAERLAANPGALSLLAVSVQFYGRVTQLETIKAGSFWPRPDVDSAIVRIDLHAERVVPSEDEEAFFRLVKAGFSQKRKQLQKNLRNLGFTRPRIEAALSQAGIESRRRAETLTLPEWADLYRALS